MEEDIMRILVALDKNPYSEYVVRLVAELAGNTWAHVTLLGIGTNGSPEEVKSSQSSSAVGEEDLAAVLDTYRKAFLGHFQETDSPYGRHTSGYQLIREKKNVLTLDYQEQHERKNLNVKIRVGNAGREILAESEQIEADLIVIGCDPGTGCKWSGAADVCGKIVKNANCSVFVVKEEKKPQMIDCCLDHDTVSQASIELINQLVTLYHAELEIIGVADAGGLKTDVDRRMARILDYYTSRNIKAWVKVVDGLSLEAIIGQAAEKNLVALWMGKESFLDKIFSRQRLGKLVTNAESSVLILR
jgi:nucleotide-binding universal stress UspA family protein